MFEEALSQEADDLKLQRSHLFAERVALALNRRDHQSMMREINRASSQEHQHSMENSPRVVAAAQGEHGEQENIISPVKESGEGTFGVDDRIVRLS